MLEVAGLSVRYGKVEAVREVSLAVAKGEVVTLIGPNGAGKTSTLNGLMGLAEAGGAASLAGTSIVGARPQDLVGLGLVLVPERRELFAGMTVRDNLLLGAFRRVMRRDDAVGESLERVYELFPRLAERRRQYAGTLSGGEQQMLAIGRGLMADPSLLMLDEPSLGLAPRVMADIFAALRRLKEEGMTILLVEQNAVAAFGLADRGYVLDGGRIVLEGETEALARDPQVRASYLGLRRGVAS